MSSRTARTLISVGVLLVAGFAFADDAEDKRVQSDIKSVSQAMFAGDVDTLLRYTHPKIIELMGGEAQARETLETGALRQMKVMTLEAVEFPAAPTFFGSEKNDFVFVPNRLRFSGGDRRVEIESFHLGVRSKGSTDWTYVDGANLNSSTAPSLFPDFPSDAEFPPVRMRDL